MHVIYPHASFDYLQKMTEYKSFVSGRDRDCVGCKLVSGSGLVGAGLYIGYHSRNLQKIVGKTVMLCLAGSKTTPCI